MIKPVKFAPNAVRPLFTPYGGGLINSQSPRSIKPNRILQCLNFEERYGEQGYASIFGYERFDGRPSPADAVYYVLPYDGGQLFNGLYNQPIIAKDGGGVAVAWATLIRVVTNSQIEVPNGSLIIALISGVWVDNLALNINGVDGVVVANGVPYIGSLAEGGIHSSLTPASNSYQTYLTQTRDVLRAAIQKVPGEGAVLGVAVYRERVYAMRNIVGGASATMWGSTSTGWSAIKTGLIAGGAWQFEVANFSGASTTLALFCVDGKNRLASWDGTTYTKADPIYQSEGLSTSNVAIGLGAKTFVHSGTARNWAVNDLLTIWSTADMANSMSGIVTGYDSGTSTLSITITSLTGTGTLASWEIGRTDYRDKPFLVSEHKDHLFTAYPLGQLQTSNIGDPLVATTTAAVFGVGSEITGIRSLRGTILAVFGRKKIDFIDGNNATDWSKSKYSVNTGAIFGTTLENAGNGFFVSDGGVTTLRAVQAFGSFAPSDLSRDFKDYVMARMKTIAGARMWKTNQYRLYFQDKTMLRLTLLAGGSNSVASSVVADTADTTSITRQQYLHQPTCFAGGVIGGDDSIFFGTSDGYVMWEDKGTSFDGEAIDYVLMTAFNHYKSPDNEKVFDELEFDLTSQDAIDISFRQLFDYDDGVNTHGTDIIASTRGSGGQFDVATWDTFSFDLPVHTKAPVPAGGIGRSMALQIALQSDFVRSFNIHGCNTKFSIIGETRP